MTSDRRATGAAPGRRDTVGLGLVGCGGAAVAVADALAALDGIRVAACHDIRPALAADLAERTGAAVHTDLAELLADPAVEAVYVGLPHDLLADVALRALAAGRHVLVEKPMAIALDDADRVVAEAVARRLVLGVVLPLRETAAVVAARRLVAGGAIGEVEAVRVTVVIDKPASYWRGGPLGRVDDAWRADPRRSGGGVVLMNGVHHLDIVRHLTGLEPVRVAGATLATRTGGVGVEEIAGATLSLSNGAVVTLAASSRSAGAASQERIEIDGSLGRLDLPDPYTGGPLQAFLRRSWGELPAGRRVEIAVPARDPYRELLEAFARAVRSGSEPSATGRDGRAALAAALAIYASAASGCSVPVELGTGPGRG